MRHVSQQSQGHQSLLKQHQMILELYLRSPNFCQILTLLVGLWSFSSAVLLILLPVMNNLVLKNDKICKNISISIKSISDNNLCLNKIKSKLVKGMRIRSLNLSILSACGWVMVARPRSVVSSRYLGFFHHLRSQDANIHAFENVFISSMSCVIEVKQVAQRATIAHLSPMCQCQIGLFKRIG